MRPSNASELAPVVPLRRGHYTATLTATDAGGQQSGPRTIELRVVR